MKHENNGKIIETYVKFKTKMYGSKVGDKETKKSKELRKSFGENEILFDGYEQCFNNKLKQYRAVILIRSYKYELCVLYLSLIHI